MNKKLFEILTIEKVDIDTKPSIWKDLYERYS